MLYDYQYAIAAVLANVFLIFLIHQRHGYPTARNRIYIEMVYGNLLLTAADMFTFFTISYPERYPMWMLYLSNSVYIMLIGGMAGGFFCYVASMIDDPMYLRDSKRIFRVLILAESALAVTTYWTHLIFYFDENMVYRHGLCFAFVYVFPVVMLIMIITALMRRRSRFSAFQKHLVIGLFVFGGVMTATQAVNPRLDLFNFSNVIILFTIYMTFENPAYYTYHSTRCFNYRALYESCKQMKEKEENPEIVLLGIFNRPRNHGIQEMSVLYLLQDEIAEKLFSAFGYRAFCVSEGKYLIVAGKGTKESEPESTLEKLEEILHQPVAVQEHKLKVEYRTRTFHFQDLNISDDFIDHLVEGFQQASIDRLFYVNQLTEIVREQHEYRETEDIMSYAMKEDLFQVAYQPIYHIKTGRIRSAEALMRLTDASGRNIPPDMIVEIAERNGNIITIGERIFEQVCRFWKENRPESIGLEFVEVNVSPVQLEQKDMSGRFIEIMERYGVSPSCINLEIVETSLDSGNTYVERNISILKKYGIHFSIDDYGSGFASVDYLFRFPISLVKIDKSILWQAMENQDAEKVFRSTLDLINDLGKSIVVEGAENEEMVKTIEEAGSHFIQGYYYSKPLAGPDFLQYVSDWNRKQEAQEQKDK